MTTTGVIGYSAENAGGGYLQYLVQKKRPPNRGGLATSRQSPVQVPGGLFTIDDDLLMVSASRMAYTRFAIHCNLALIGVGSSSLDPGYAFVLSLRVIILSDMVHLHECPCLLTS